MKYHVISFRLKYHVKGINTGPNYFKVLLVIKIFIIVCELYLIVINMIIAFRLSLSLSLFLIYNNIKNKWLLIR